MLNVVVTGGTRGIGLGMVRRLAAVGYRVIAVARNNTDELESARTSLAAGGGQIAFRAFDLTRVDEIPALVKELRAAFGPLYGLINNAGSGSSGILSLMRDSQIERLIRLNTLAPVLLTKYVAKSMMTARAGRVVNIASVAASTGYAGLSVYGATKASLVGFTHSLARELGPLGITVNAIAPGFIETDMTQELSESDLNRVARRSALRRLALPVDIAAGAEFLLGEAGRNITGTVLTIDAGNTA